MIIPQLLFVFGSKTQTYMVVAGNFIRFYDKIGRQLTPVSKILPNIVSKFKLPWEAI